MAFEPGIKLRAIELYLEMHSVPKVHEKICREYLPVLGEDGLPSAITVRKWIEKNELPEVVKNMEIDVIARTRSREIEDLLAKKERDETLLNKVRDKAAEELDQMEYTSAMEATKPIDMAINSSRKITDQTINLQFITDVLEAITATITDEAMRHKLGIELRKIFQKYSNT